MNLLCISTGVCRVTITFSDRIKIDNFSIDDYIQVIDDSSRTRVYSPITGNSWPTDQLSYPSSNLKVVFWSDRDKTQGRGFSLQFSCPTTIDEVPTHQQESGDSFAVLTTA